ncbi:MAG: response regulator transcription factor [Myxococcales bacterium]|nr:MAG: response regulator transcription factor [Myxococcales bacterium]
MPHILVVEDDQPIADAVLYALHRDGVGAEGRGSLGEARRRLAEPGVDLVILDLTLPDGSGFSLLDELRRQGSPPRVIVLTSRDEDVDCVAALEAGADDFVTKPFSPRALVARVRAVLRRGGAVAGPTSGPGVDVTPSTPPPPPPHAALEVDGERRRVRWAGAEVNLTRIEFDLLGALAEAPGRVRTRTQLVERIWGPSYALTERTVDSHFKGLRRKLEEAGAPDDLIETVRGVGFRLREGA